MRRWILAMALFLGACTGAPSGISLAGSTSVQPLSEVLAESFEREQGGPRISIQGGGSTAGIQAVLQGVASIGAVSRRLAPAETRQGLVEHIIAYDVLTIVVHPDNPVQGLSRAQLQQLFRGDMPDWKRISGRPGPVHVISREAGSGSREAFRQLVGPVSPRAIVQGSSGAIRVAVMENPQAIGYVTLGAARMGGLKPLAVDGLAPGARGYPLVRPLSFVTRGEPAGEVARFLRYVRSPMGQRLVRAEGLVPISEVQTR